MRTVGEGQERGKVMVNKAPRERRKANKCHAAPWISVGSRKSSVCQSVNKHKEGKKHKKRVEHGSQGQNDRAAWQQRWTRVLSKQHIGVQDRQLTSSCTLCKLMQALAAGEPHH
eukprot:315235-Pelagomonas_calceolata.AAC.1